MTVGFRVFACGLVAGCLAVAAAGRDADARPLRHRAVRPPAETISLFAGPCRGGGCAVYRIAVRPTGVATVEGLAHTSVLGLSRRAIGRLAYEQFASALSPFRPQGRAADAACRAQSLGEPRYRITWSGRGGAATLEHDGGCDTPLDAILANAPAQLGIADLTALQPEPNSVPKPHIFYF